MFLFQVDISEQVGNDIPHEFENILDKSYENVHPTPNNLQVVQYYLDNFKIDVLLKSLCCSFHKLQELHSISYTKAKDGRGKPSLPHEHMITKVPYASLIMLYHVLFFWCIQSN